MFSQSFFLSVFSMSVPDNTIEYRVFCTHREGWGLANNVAIAKIDYYAQIKKLREDLNLSFVKANQPVLLHNYTHSHSEHNKHHHNHSNNTSVPSSPAESPTANEGRGRSTNVDPASPPPLPDPEMMAHRHIPAALLNNSLSSKSDASYKVYSRNKLGSPLSMDSKSSRKSLGKKDK